MRLGDLRTRLKLTLCFGLLLAVFAIASVRAYVSIEAINDAASSSRRSLVVAAQAERLLTLVLEQQNALRGYVIKGDRKFADTYEETKRTFDQVLADFADTTTVAEQKAAAARMKAAMADWHATIGEPAMALMQDPATQGRAAELTGVKSLSELRAIQKTMMDTANQRVALRDAEQRDATRAAVTSLVAGSLVALGVATLLGILLVKSLASPLVAMAGSMTRLAGGDRSIEVPAIGRKDEIGQMAGAVVSFKQAALEKLRLERDAAEQRLSSDGERQRNEAVRATSAQQQAFVVASVATGLGKLSDGDLTFRLDHAFAPEYEQLRMDFNAAVAKLQATVEVITGTAEGLRSGTDEISSAAEDLSRRTEQQAASLEETAAALDEITATVRKTADGALQARTAVEQAKADTEQSGQVMRLTKDAMTGIEKSSGQIGRIIGVIDEIAFQTNLLALNAGVEAARAGDAGRGFAVVASEVRALAQRSAEAAKEIKALIATSGAQVRQGVDLVGKTASVLDRVVAQVGDISRIIADIAASTQEQAMGLDQVNTAVNQMDHVTQQNAAMVEQSTAASHALAQEADELGRLVGQFRISSDQKTLGRSVPARSRAA